MKKAMIMKFNAMLQLKLFKHSRSKHAGTMTIGDDGKVLKWGYLPKIKHVDELNKVYADNKEAIDNYYKREN